MSLSIARRSQEDSGQPCNAISSIACHWAAESAIQHRPPLGSGRVATRTFDGRGWSALLLIYYLQIITVHSSSALSIGDRYQSDASATEANAQVVVPLGSHPPTCRASNRRHRIMGIRSVLCQHQSVDVGRDYRIAVLHPALILSIDNNRHNWIGTPPGIHKRLSIRICPLRSMTRV